MSTSPVVELAVLEPIFSLAKYTDRQALSPEVFKSDLYIVVQSPDEFSIYCGSDFVRGATAVDDNWRVIHCKGSVENHETGIVANITHPLADVGISVIVFTSFESGYFGVKNDDLPRAITVLQSSPHIQFV